MTDYDLLSLSWEEARTLCTADNIEADEVRSLIRLRS